MKINEDCIRDIMKLLVDDLVIFVDKKKVELGKLSIYYISSCLKNYKIEDICYSIMLLSQIKYIKGIGLDDINGRMIYMEDHTIVIYRYGVDFYVKKRKEM